MLHPLKLTGLNQRNSPPLSRNGAQNDSGKNIEPTASTSTRARAPRRRAWISASRNCLAIAPPLTIYISRQMDSRASAMAASIRLNISPPVSSHSYSTSTCAFMPESPPEHFPLTSGCAPCRLSSRASLPPATPGMCPRAWFAARPRAPPQNSLSPPPPSP